MANTKLRHLETEIALYHQSVDGEEDFYAVVVTLSEPVGLWDLAVSGWDKPLYKTGAEHDSETEARQAGIAWLEDHLSKQTSS